MSREELGCPVLFGSESDGATIPLFNLNYEKVSDIFDELAKTSQFTWGVNPQTSQLFFETPSSIPAPFTLSNDQVLFDSVTWTLDGADYRNRQAVKLNYDAFPHSMEFFVGSGQTSFTLRHPVQQVTNAWAGLFTCNTATGTFSGQPSPGDTITIGPNTAIGWQGPAHIYGPNGIIIVNGFVQKITFPTSGTGTSGSSAPTFPTITGDTVTDGTLIWTCQGPAGLSTGVDTYTFVSALDNTQFGQALNLNVEYTRADGNVIECEDTALVSAYAAITHGTGKVQQITDDSSQGLISTSAAAGLLDAQTTLESYSVPPQRFQFKTYTPGLFPGMTLPVSLTAPTGATTLLNGDWMIEEVKADLVPTNSPYLGINGHYEYTISLVDIQQTVGYLDFWQGMGGASQGGSGSGGALVSTGGGAQSTAGQPSLNLETNGTANGSQTTLNLVPGSHVTITDDGLGDVTIAATSPLTTKGDVFVHGSVDARLPVGSNGQVLTADSTQADGLSWQTITGTGTVTHTGGALTANLPVFGNGGDDVEVGTRRGNTTTAQMADTTSNPTTGRAASFDANGNIKDSGVFPTQTATSVSHEFLTAYNAATGTFTLGQPTEADLSLSNITTNDVSITKHGLAPKAPNDATKYLDGTGAYSVPSGSSLLLTSKGDILTFGTVQTRLAVGSNGQVLTADSTQVDGLAWETIPTATTSILGLVKPDGTTVTISGGVISSSLGPQPYDLVYAYPGAQLNSAIIQLITFTRNVAFVGNFVGSTAHCGANPTLIGNVHPE